jgi:hypothetical protein
LTPQTTVYCTESRLRLATLPLCTVRSLRGCSLLPSSVTLASCVALLILHRRCRTGQVGECGRGRSCSALPFHAVPHFYFPATHFASTSILFYLLCWRMPAGCCALLCAAVRCCALLCAAVRQMRREYCTARGGPCPVTTAILPVTTGI